MDPNEQRHSELEADVQGLQDSADAVTSAGDYTLDLDDLEELGGIHPAVPSSPPDIGTPANSFDVPPLRVPSRQPYRARPSGMTPSAGAQDEALGLPDTAGGYTPEEQADIDSFIDQQHASWAAGRGVAEGPAYDMREDSGMAQPANLRSDLEDFASNMSESYESVHQTLNTLSDIISGHGRNVVDINARLLRWGIV